MKSPVPAWCYECGQYISHSSSSPSDYLCADCFAGLPVFDPGICVRCGKPHRSSDCKTEWAKEFSDCYALFSYQDPIRKWISSLKYSRNLIAGRLLQGLISDWLQEQREILKNFDFLVPVPLHFGKLNRRGLNQSAFLLNKQKVLVCHGRLVRKKRGTTQQAGKTKKEREANLSGAFEVSPEVKGKNLLLFDDVCTTGETLREISRALKTAGANEVGALVLSRNI